MISNIILVVSQIVGIIASIVMAVERPGDGEAKKAEVIAAVAAILAELDVPDWVKTVFGNSVVLGVVINVLVNTLNKTGWVHINPT